MFTATPSFTCIHGEVLNPVQGQVCVRRSAYESESYRPTFGLRSPAPWAAEEKQQNDLHSLTDIRVVR